MIVIACCGVCCLDMYSVMSQFPRSNTKTRTESTAHSEVGGNATNVLLCLSALLQLHAERRRHDDQSPNISVRLLSKVGDDLFGQYVLQLLSGGLFDDIDHCTRQGKVNIDTTFVARERGSTAISHIIVSGSRHEERTIIHSPASTSELLLNETDASLFLRDIDLLFLDGRHVHAAKQLVQHCSRIQTSIKVVLELERIKPSEPELLDLIPYSHYILCSESFIDEYVSHEKLSVHSLNRFNSEDGDDGDEGDKIIGTMVHLFERMKTPTSNSYVNISFGSRGSLLLTRRSNFLQEAKEQQYASQFVETSLSRIVTQVTANDNNGDTCSSSNAPIITRDVVAEEEIIRPTVSYARVHTHDSYVLVHCQAWKQLSLRDTTCAGDSFHASLVHSIVSPVLNEGVALQNASILAGFVCSDIGLRKGVNKYCRSFTSTP